MEKEERYKVINLRFKPEEWAIFERIVESYRNRFSGNMSMHLVAKSLYEQGLRQVLAEEVR